MICDQRNGKCLKDSVINSIKVDHAMHILNYICTRQVSALKQ